MSLEITYKIGALFRFDYKLRFEGYINGHKYKGQVNFKTRKIVCNCPLSKRIIIEMDDFENTEEITGKPMILSEFLAWTIEQDEDYLKQLEVKDEKR